MESVSKLVNVGDFVYYVVNEGSSVCLLLIVFVVVSSTNFLTVWHRNLAVLFWMLWRGILHCATHGAEHAARYIPHKNALECPLLSQTKILQIVPSTGIMRSISLVQKCGTVYIMWALWNENNKNCGKTKCFLQLTTLITWLEESRMLLVCQILCHVLYILCLYYFIFIILYIVFHSRVDNVNVSTVWSERIVNVTLIC